MTRGFSEAMDAHLYGGGIQVQYDEQADGICMNCDRPCYEGEDINVRGLWWCSRCYGLIKNDMQERVKKLLRTMDEAEQLAFTEIVEEELDNFDEFII